MMDLTQPSLHPRPLSRQARPRLACDNSPRRRHASTTRRFATVTIAMPRSTHDLQPLKASLHPTAQGRDLTGRWRSPSRIACIQSTRVGDEITVELPRAPSTHIVVEAIYPGLHNSDWGPRPYPRAVMHWARSQAPFCSRLAPGRSPPPPHSMPGEGRGPIAVAPPSRLRSSNTLREAYPLSTLAASSRCWCGHAPHSLVLRAPRRGAATDRNWRWASRSSVDRAFGCQARPSPHSMSLPYPWAFFPHGANTGACRPHLGVLDRSHPPSRRCHRDGDDDRRGGRGIHHRHQPRRAASWRRYGRSNR